MATYRVTDPKTGRTLRLTGDSPPTEQELTGIFSSLGPAPTPQKQFKSLEQFSRNLISDVGTNVRGIGELSAMIPGPLQAMKFAQGENVYDPQRLQATGQGLVEGVKQIPSQLLKTISHPIESAYERPVSTALDLSTIAGGGLGLAKLGAMGTRMAARKVLPGLARGAAGIPEKATEMVLQKPSILSRPPVPESELNRVVGQPLISAIKRTKEAIGEEFGNVYRNVAGMEGPMQEIIETPIAQKIRPVTKDVPVAQKLVQEESKIIGGKSRMVPGEVITEKQVTGFKPGQLFAIPRKTHSYEDLLVNKNLASEAFKKGDQQALNKLYKRYVGTQQSDLSKLAITDQDKLQILTRLKRETQQQAEFNKAPITLKPIDKAKDAAFKKISSDIDELRKDLPGGDELAQVDDAWKELNDIYDTIQKDLSDPGKARDTMMRLLRGDNTWLTSGKMKIKTDSIRKVEALTGKDLLEPAMEELTRQVFGQVMGKGFFPNIVRAGATALGGLGVGTGNPAAFLGSAAMLGASSPKLIGLGIKGASKVGAGVSTAFPPAATAGGIGAISSITKTMTEEIAKKFLRKAKGNKEKATQLAIEAGYDPYQ